VSGRTSVEEVLGGCGGCIRKRRRTTRRAFDARRARDRVWLEMSADPSSVVSQDVYFNEEINRE
jgi:hypothetical protein